MRLRSSIDIGTNTVLLLVAQQSDSSFEIIHEEQQIPRLGKGVDVNKTLSLDSMNRVIDALLHYKETLTNRFPEVESPIITATSAVRDARNKSDFLDLIKEKLNWEVRILLGSEEAEWTYAGALSAVDVQADKEYAILDIGGGSTEIAIGRGFELHQKHSYDMGSVRFTERFFKQIPPSHLEKESIKQAVKNTYAEYQFQLDQANFTLVGVAGTVTSAVFLIKKLKTYSASSINGSMLTKESIESLIEHLCLFTVSELEEAYPIVMKGRADIFLAGLYILVGFMDLMKTSSIQVSTGGIRHGTLLKTL